MVVVRHWLPPYFAERLFLQAVSNKQQFTTGHKGARLRDSLPIFLIALCFLLTLKQAHVWRSELSLWEHVVKVSPNAPGPRLALGRSYQHIGRFEDAIAQYLVVLDLSVSNENRPFRFAVGLNMAKLLDEEHKSREAVDVLNALIPSYPEYGDLLADTKVTYLRHAGATCRIIKLMGLPCGA